MKSVPSAARLLVVVGLILACQTPAPPPAAPQPEDGGLMDHRLLVVVPEPEGADRRGRDLYLQTMLLPRYALAYQWSVWETKDGQLANTNEGRLARFTPVRLGTEWTAGGRALLRYELSFRARALGTVPYRAVRVSLSGGEWERVLPEDPLVEYFRRALAQVGRSRARMRLQSVTFTAPSTLAAEVWVAD